MRIAELSTRSGIPVATIKFYRREGLLPPGRHVSANQVEYDTSHLHRLRLIRALTEIGGLSLPSVRALLDDPLCIPSDVLAASTERPRRASARDERWRAARDQIVQLLAVNGWRVGHEALGLDAVADVLSCLQDLDQALPDDVLEGYVRLARAIVAVEMRLVRGLPQGTIPPAVQVAVFHEKLLAALRGLAREDSWSGNGQPPVSKARDMTHRRRSRAGPPFRISR